MNIQIGIGLFVMFLGYLSVVIGIKGLYPDENNYVLKTEVVKALDEGRWNRFHFQGYSEEAYYPAKDIDEKIDRLNKLLKNKEN